MVFTTGIELEAGFAGRCELSTAAETQINHSLRGTVASHWSTHSDSSAGHEIKSPILAEADDIFNQVPLVCHVMHEARLRIHGKCGLHVHVGFKPISQKDLSAKYRVMRLLSRHEDTFFKMLRPAGSRSNYCQRIPVTGWQSMSTGQGFEFWETSHTKYWWANAKALGSHGTIEFRLANGSLEPDYIIGLVSVLQCLFYAAVVSKEKVDWAKPATNSDTELADAFMADIGTAKNTAFGQRAEIFIKRELGVAGAPPTAQYAEPPSATSYTPTVAPVEIPVPRRRQTRVMAAEVVATASTAHELNAVQHFIRTASDYTHNQDSNIIQ